MNEALRAYFPVADMIAAPFGPCCEAAIHDFSQPETSVVHVAGQSQMAQDDALLQDALSVKYRMAGLRHHGLNGGPGLGKVIRCSGKLCREGGGDVFQVSQPDVNGTPPGLHTLHRLVAACVADDGQMQPLRPGQIQRGNDPGPPLPGGDQIDVVGSLGL